MSGVKSLGAQLVMWMQAFRDQWDGFDIVFFVVGCVICCCIFLLVFKKRKKQYIAAVRIYEDALHTSKKTHMEELAVLKQRAENVELILKGKDLESARMVAVIDKQYANKESASVDAIFHLKQQLEHLRHKQLLEVQGFQEDINRLESNVANMHDSHAQAMEKSEIEINDLRKQMYALMYRV